MVLNGQTPYGRLRQKTSRPCNPPPSIAQLCAAEAARKRIGSCLVDMPRLRPERPRGHVYPCSHHCDEQNTGGRP